MFINIINPKGSDLKFPISHQKKHIDMLKKQINDRKIDPNSSIFFESKSKETSDTYPLMYGIFMLRFSSSINADIIKTGIKNGLDLTAVSRNGQSLLSILTLKAFMLESSEVHNVLLNAEPTLTRQELLSFLSPHTTNSYILKTLKDFDQEQKVAEQMKIQSNNSFFFSLTKSLSTFMKAMPSKEKADLEHNTQEKKPLLPIAKR